MREPMHPKPPTAKPLTSVDCVFKRHQLWTSFCLVAPKTPRQNPIQPHIHPNTIFDESMKL